MNYFEMVTMSDEDIIKGMENLARKLRNAPNIESTSEVTFKDTCCLDMGIQWLRKVHAYNNQFKEESNETKAK